MRKIIVVLAAILAIACKPVVGPAPTPGAPVKIALSGAKGVYLAAGAGANLSRARSISGRDIVTASGASLGAVDDNGLPQSVTWTDAGGLTVTASVSKAVQVSAGYILLTYNAGAGDITAAVNLTSGALASLGQVPDNWAKIAVSSSTAFFVHSGSVWSANLDTGACLERSTGGNSYNYPSGPYGLSFWDYDYTTGQKMALYMTNQSWPASTWIYADAAGNAYAFYCDTGFPQCQAIEVGGGLVDFGDNPLAYYFCTWLPGSSLVYPAWVGMDDANNLYVIQSAEVWDNMIERVFGGQAVTGYALRLWPLSLSVNQPGILKYNCAYGVPLGYYISSSPDFKMTHIGRDMTLAHSIYSKGDLTFAVTPTSMTAYDTSAVPRSTILNDQNFGPSAVTNWQVSSGQTFAGPAGEQKISLVKLSGAVATTSQLVSSDTPIISWSPVGGALFWTDASGTYSGTVNAAAGTLENVAPYSGGQVQAVTQ